LDPSTPCPKCHKQLDGAPNFCPACGEDLRGLTPESSTLAGPWAGAIIDGRYRLTEKLGEGGMGTVYKVEHVRMGKVLALKVLRPEIAIDKKLKQRFHQEARLVSKLSHPNTIQVFDFGELEDGSLYIAMEYLSGRDLAWTLRAHGSLPERRAISIASQVLASLAEAHENNIIHRDVKPANIMLLKGKAGEDRVKVLDFGIAKLTEDEQRKHITGVADFLGTPAYMSPEQAKGEGLDPRSDLYSVGAMLFELVTGRGLFVGPTPLSIITKHMTEPPPRFADVAPDKFLSSSLEQVVRKSLAKDRKERFASAERMRDALEHVRTDLAPPNHHFTPLPDEITGSKMARREDFDRFERSLRAKRALAPLVFLLLLAGLAASGFRYWQREKDEGLSSVEREPNNDPSQANRIALGSPIRGMIGTPLSARDSDRDLFVVNLPEPAALTIEVTGVPDMNLLLEVLQPEISASGEQKLVSRLFLDDAPAGEGERVDALAAQAGPLYVRIQERAYFTEPPRPPRETTHASYLLTVSRTQTDGQTEVEPNDTLATATRVGMGKAVLGFTGAAVPYKASFAEQAFSGVDFLVAYTEDTAPRAMAAILIGPPAGAIAAVDAAAFEAWQRKSNAAKELGKHTPLPEPILVAKQPKLLSLSPSSVGFGLRIQAADSSVRPGSQYAVAFVSDGPEGMAGALDLASFLLRRNRAREGHDVLRLAESRFPQSPQLAKLRALQGESKKLVSEAP
jgi:serine/threonine protein kinase